MNRKEHKSIYMRLYKGFRRSIIVLNVIFLALNLTACGSLEKAKELADTASKKIDEKMEEKEEEDNAKYTKILEEKADYYGIDAEGVEISQGGGYVKVPIDTIRSYEDIEDKIVFFRRWLRFAYAELGRQYFVGFFDSEHPEIMYMGFSDQDYGYTSEYYWNDRDIVRQNRLDYYVIGIEKVTHFPAEEFTEITGIDEAKLDEIRHKFHENYPSSKGVEINKEDHDIAFIPGDTINHLEKFVIGDKSCIIEPGTYIVDLPDYWGVLHVTDADDNTKYRLDPYYRDGRMDEMYEYSAIPAQITLEKGDIVYMSNGPYTFDRVD